MQQSEILNLLVDTSGSMYEMGKLLLVRNLVTFIREFSDITPERFPFDGIRLVTFNDGLKLVELNKNCETPHFQASGKADLIQLKEWLEAEIEKTPTVKAIVFSDGSFPGDMLKSFGAWHEECPHLTLRAVAIGADASHTRLKALSTNKIVFRSEDISLALESLCAGVDAELPGPVSVSKYKLHTVQEDEEGWE
jgi:hypothetical protein